MSCLICTYFSQFFVNVLNLFDHALNTITLGDADETVSARVGRARLGGKHWATVLCKILTYLAKILTFGQSAEDHCTYALDKMIRPSSREIFSFTTMHFNPTPVSEVEVIDNGSD